MIATRILPTLGFAPRADRLVERNVMNYRRTWIVLVSGFFEPLFYLLGIGFGIGALVGTVTGRMACLWRPGCWRRRR
jgi:lipooligosaccharide transport system permease protein